MVLSILFVWSPLSVRAETIDTEHLFAFTIGTDPGELGEKEIEGQTTGRLGKRDGSYTGLSQTLSAEFTPVLNFRLEVSAASIYQDISGVTGLDDRRRGGWQALSLDLRYRLLDRDHTSFGLLIDAEPRWGRIDETTGEPVDQYGIDLSIARAYWSRWRRAYLPGGGSGLGERGFQPYWVAAAGALLPASCRPRAGAAD